MDYVFDYFRSININEITLEVRESNSVAIKLYESYGFKIATVRKNYYSNNENALLMYLKIGSD
jgi:ribosomal-protein-alanine N-acetyltransferase